MPRQAPPTIGIGGDSGGHSSALSGSSFHSPLVLASLVLDLVPASSAPNRPPIRSSIALPPEEVPASRLAPELVPASLLLAGLVLLLLELMLVPPVPLVLLVELVGLDAVLLPELVLTELSPTDASTPLKETCASLPGSESQGTASPSAPLPHDDDDKASRSRAQALRVNLGGKLGVRG
jgi:hypothetical protein